MTLQGRSALVTGGSRGLGEVIAQRLRQAGAKVTICARDIKALDACRNKIAVEAVHADITSLYQVSNMFDASGPFDIIVNNAAVLGPVGPVQDNDSSDWMAAIDINLGGPVNCIQHALPFMIKQGYGKIINIVGGGAADPFPRRTAYACSKAALVRLTDSVAEEVRQHHIDVNAVAPGPMATRMMDDTLNAGPEKLGEREFAEAQNFVKTGKKPLARAAELCAYLASAESDGLTGRFLSARFDPWPFTPERIEQIMERDLYAMRRFSPARQVVDGKPQYAA